jgi:two-component system, OmpR family, Ni(II)-sensor and/or redox sensor kinase NrsS
VSQPRSPAPQLLWRARLRLAGLSLLVMGSLLYGAGLAMGRLLLQTQETAIQRELETLAGTLHDSLKPALPQQARPSASLAAVLPGLCLAGEPCRPPADLIHRHAISATDPDRFKLRVLDQRGGLIASSPGPMPQVPTPGQLGWSLSVDRNSGRWGTYAIHLHHAHNPGEPTWGYLQISRSLADLDAEAERLWWLGHGIFLLAMLAMAAASWWLAGLAMAPLLEAYRRQEQFSSDVAHELRTPLANLLAVLEAERGAAAQANPSAMASLNRVLAQGQRLQRLIADLLLLASLEQPTRPDWPEPCRIAECLEDLIEDFSETASARAVTLQLQISATNAVVSGRNSELNRLLANLLSNALQHSPAGGVVRVELDRQGSELCVAVSDQGPGLAEGEQERIFERFYRSDSSRSRQSGGTGLGLAIAQAIARRYRGRITLQSTPGCGSTFLLQLPALA